MSNNEARVISAILKRRDLADVMNNSPANLFKSHKDIWGFLFGHYRKYREVPSLEAVQEQFSDFEYVDTQDATGHYVDLLRKDIKREELTKLILGASKSLTEDGADPEYLDKIAKHIEQRTLKIQQDAGDARAVDVRDVDSALEHMDKVRDYRALHDGAPGINTGFDEIDLNYPTGFAAGHFIVILGYSGHMKSWMAIKLAINAWLKGNSVMYINLEMTPEELRDRILFLVSQYSMSDLVRAEIDPEDFKQWASEFMQGKAEFTLIGNEGFGAFTTTMVQSKIEQYKPSIVFCHEKGTDIFDESIGEWMKVEDHPTSIEMEAEGVEVELSSYGFNERVSKDHRYLVMEQAPIHFYNKNMQHRGNSIKALSKPKWEFANNLTKNHFIGLPLTTEYIDYKPEGVVSQIVDHEDFWWFLGLWYGDGSANFNEVAVSVAWKQDGTIGARLKRFVEESGYTLRRHKGYDGQTQYKFTCSSLSRWLQTLKVRNSVKIFKDEYLKISFENQFKLAEGYANADGDNNGITSINYEGLVGWQKLFANLGQPTTIYRQKGEYERTFPNGITSTCATSYRLQYCKDKEAYASAFVRHGYLWRRVRSVTNVGKITVCPIETETHEYITAMGLSHNCDYLQLFSDSQMSGSEIERAKRTAREFKQLASVTDVPIVVITAVTGKDKKDRLNPPEIAQVAWSSEIEYAANLAFAVHTHRDDDGNALNTEIVCRKNRHGALFDFHVKMDLDNGVITEINPLDQLALIDEDDDLFTGDDED